MRRYIRKITLLTSLVNSLCGKMQRRFEDHNARQRQGLLRQPQNYPAKKDNFSRKCEKLWEAQRLSGQRAELRIVQTLSGLCVLGPSVTSPAKMTVC